MAFSANFWVDGAAGNTPLSAANLDLRETALAAYTDTQVALSVPLTQKSAPNGVASLNSGGTIPPAQLASGTRDGTKFLRDDGTWQTVAAGGTPYTLPDATSSIKGGIQLAGDLGGTAAAPTVPGLATKASSTHTHDTSAIVSGTLSTARLGSGTPATNKYVDGAAGAWTALPTTLPPTDGTVTNVKVASGAAIAASKLGTGTPAAGTYLDGAGAWTALPSGGTVNPDDFVTWWQPKHNNYKASTCPPTLAVAGSAPNAGQVAGMKFYAPVAFTFTSVSILVVVQGTGATSLNNCYFAVYNQAGQRLGVSADQSAVLTGTTATSIGTAIEVKATINVDSGKSLSFPGGTGAYGFVGFVIGTQASTGLQYGRTSGGGVAPPNVGLTLGTDVLNSMIAATGATAMPTTISPTTNLRGVQYWMALS